MNNVLNVVQSKLGQYLIDKYGLNDCMVTLMLFRDGITPPSITVSYSDARERIDAGMLVGDLMDNFDLTLDGVIKLGTEKDG